MCPQWEMICVKDAASRGKEVNMKKRARWRSSAKRNGAIHTVFAQTTIVLLPKDAPSFRAQRRVPTIRTGIRRNSWAALHDERASNMANAARSAASGKSSFPRNRLVTRSENISHSDGERERESRRPQGGRCYRGERKKIMRLIKKRESVGSPPDALYWIWCEKWPWSRKIFLTKRRDAFPIRISILFAFTPVFYSNPE